MKITPSQTAFLSLDLQAGILSMLPDHEQVISKASKAMEFARKNHLLIVHVGLGFEQTHPEISDADSLFLQIKQKNLFVKGTPSAEFHSRIYKAGELIVYKQRVSAFSHNHLELMLRAKGIKHLVLTGVATGGIVLSTVRQAFDIDLSCTVLHDACADANPDVHRILIEKILPWQATVNSVDDLQLSPR